jgi:hypothetical protein
MSCFIAVAANTTVRSIVLDVMIFFVLNVPPQNRLAFAVKSFAVHSAV